MSQAHCGTFVGQLFTKSEPRICRFGYGVQLRVIRLFSRYQAQHSPDARAHCRYHCCLLQYWSVSNCHFQYGKNTLSATHAPRASLINPALPRSSQPRHNRRPRRRSCRRPYTHFNPCSFTIPRLSDPAIGPDTCQ